MPANLTFPNVKIQSNFTFSLSGTGDPSTFTFTMDALPGYTYFDKSREVLCVIQVIEDQNNASKQIQPVMPHNDTLEHEIDEIEDSRYIGFGGTSPTKGNHAIAFGANKVSVAVEGTSTNTATGLGLDTEESVTNLAYASSNTDIATVTSAGVITGVAVGKATITATGTIAGKEYKDTCEVTVTAAG